MLLYTALFFISAWDEAGDTSSYNIILIQPNQPCKNRTTCNDLNLHQISLHYWLQIWGCNKNNPELTAFVRRLNPLNYAWWFTFSNQRIRKHQQTSDKSSLIGICKQKYCTKTGASLVKAVWKDICFHSCPAYWSCGESCHPNLLKESSGPTLSITR